jgi:hypothetical protein
VFVRSRTREAAGFGHRTKVSISKLMDLDPWDPGEKGKALS